jgi:hypothetical protein
MRLIDNNTIRERSLIAIDSFSLTSPDTKQ